MGDFKVLACVGRGGMGQVYRAQHLLVGREVALKILDAGVARDPASHEQLVREARAGVALRHPNVVSTYDVGFHEGIAYIVMELLLGEDLAQRLRHRGPLSETALADVVVALSGGLAAVHESGIIHCDIKPGNVFLAESRGYPTEPKLLDFGASQLAGGALSRSALSPFQPIGTPQYMSPEASAGGPITAASDQYSLAVMMYECLTGSNPFLAPTPSETASRVAAGRFQRFVGSGSPTSRRLGEVIERGMQVEPERRFPDVRALGCELLCIASPHTQLTWNLGLSPRPHGSLSRADATRVAFVGWRPRWVGLSLATALGAAAGVWLGAPERPSAGRLPPPLASSLSVPPPLVGGLRAPKAAQPNCALPYANPTPLRATPPAAGPSRLEPSRDDGTTALSGPQPVELGTNAAPIFD